MTAPLVAVADQHRLAPEHGLRRGVEAGPQRALLGSLDAGRGRPVDHQHVTHVIDQAHTNLVGVDRQPTGRDHDGDDLVHRTRAALSSVAYAARREVRRCSASVIDARSRACAAISANRLTARRVLGSTPTAAGNVTLSTPTGCRRWSRRGSATMVPPPADLILSRSLRDHARSCVDGPRRRVLGLVREGGRPSLLTLVVDHVQDAAAGVEDTDGRRDRLHDLRGGVRQRGDDLLGRSRGGQSLADVGESAVQISLADTLVREIDPLVGLRCHVGHGVQCRSQRGIDAQRGAPRHREHAHRRPRRVVHRECGERREPACTRVGDGARIASLHRAEVLEQHGLVAQDGVGQREAGVERQAAMAPNDVPREHRSFGHESSAARLEHAHIGVEGAHDGARLGEHHSRHIVMRQRGAQLPRQCGQAGLALDDHPRRLDALEGASAHLADRSQARLLRDFDRLLGAPCHPDDGCDRALDRQRCHADRGEAGRAGAGVPGSMPPLIASWSPSSSTSPSRAAAATGDAAPRSISLNVAARPAGMLGFGRRRTRPSARSTTATPARSAPTMAGTCLLTALGQVTDVGGHGQLLAQVGQRAHRLRTAAQPVLVARPSEQDQGQRSQDDSPGEAHQPRREVVDGVAGSHRQGPIAIPHHQVLRRAVSGGRIRDGQHGVAVTELEPGPGRQLRRDLLQQADALVPRGHEADGLVHTGRAVIARPVQGLGHEDCGLTGRQGAQWRADNGLAAGQSPFDGIRPDRIHAQVEADQDPVRIGHGRHPGHDVVLVTSSCGSARHLIPDLEPERLLEFGAVGVIDDGDERQRLRRRFVDHVPCEGVEGLGVDRPFATDQPGPAAHPRGEGLDHRGRDVGGLTGQAVGPAIGLSSDHEDGDEHRGDSHQRHQREHQRPLPPQERARRIAEHRANLRRDAASGEWTGLLHPFG